MVVLRPQSEFGHAPPPQTPYSIVSNLPGWNLTKQFRDGDMSVLASVVHIYPRFSPTHFAAQLGQEIVKKVGMTGKRCMFYLNPIMIPYTRRHVSLEHRKEHAMKVEDLTWKIVDIAGHRLFAVLFNPVQTPGISLSWSQPGLGISIRGAEELLKSVATMEEVPWKNLENPPEATFTPESWAHTGLRERINELLHRAAINPDKVICDPNDSEKYGFILVVDDTIGSFGNVDVFSQTDILLSSLTKSFSGYGNVMGGSAVVNPLSSHYRHLAAKLTSTHKNELFAADAQVLLSNSQDFLARTRRLNRNAEAMASYFQRHIADPDSPVVNVQYPTRLPSKPNYDALMRRGTSELPEPGYGCLLTVDFESTSMARIFYDRCGFYPSPHLGAHVTIMMAYNMMAFGKEPADRAYYRNIGAKEESVRFSAGLEDVEDLIDTIKDALDFVKEARIEELLREAKPTEVILNQ